MIYVTGDCHGKFKDRFSLLNFPEQVYCTKDDYVIIAGDFAGVWEKELTASENEELEWLEQRRFTTLFVDGNHENFDRLNDYPIEEWNGGKVHKIKPSVIHLMRGQIFQIAGKKLFAFGGAASHDKKYRVDHIDWWEQEMPSKAEMEDGIKNLGIHENKVDLIITHCAPTQIETGNYGFMNCYRPNSLTDYLQRIYDTVSCEHWYFGHYHSNKQIDAQISAVYDEILRVSDLEDFLQCVRKGIAGRSYEELRKAYVVRSEDTCEIIGDLELQGEKYIGKIKVLPMDCLEAALLLRSESGEDVTLLNMASCRKIGGAVWQWEQPVAQEENICLRSSLLESLQSSDALAYYEEGRRSAPVGIDGAVFSPYVAVLRDTRLEYLSKEQQTVISVVSAAAPEVSLFSGLCEDMDYAQMQAVWERRILSMLAVCKKYEAKRLVLGAWGCGQYGSDPQMVAECFEKVLCEYEVRYCFDEIIFAILPGKNYDVFRQAFEK